MILRLHRNINKIVSSQNIVEVHSGKKNIYIYNIQVWAKVG